MEKMSVAQAREAASVGRHIELHGWVRTRRDCHGGCSFLELNGGSCFGNVQSVADGKPSNHGSEIKKLGAGPGIRVLGEVRASPAQGQATEVHAQSITVYGWADAETYPLQ